MIAAIAGIERNHVQWIAGMMAVRIRCRNQQKFVFRNGFAESPPACDHCESRHIVRPSLTAKPPRQCSVIINHLVIGQQSAVYSANMRPRLLIVGQTFNYKPESAARTGMSTKGA